MFLLFILNYWWFFLLFFLFAFYLGYLYGKKVTKQEYEEKKIVLVIEDKRKE